MRLVDYQYLALEPSTDHEEAHYAFGFTAARHADQALVILAAYAFPDGFGLSLVEALKVVPMLLLELDKLVVTLPLGLILMNEELAVATQLIGRAQRLQTLTHHVV